MARYKAWACPDCGGKFRWLHHPDDAPPPDRCQLCGAWMSEAEPAFMPQAPAVRNGAIVKAVEDVYYAMEDGSRHAAEQVAAISPGVSVKDLSHMHINDMNDRQKEGDIAWKPPPPSPVSEAIRAGRGGWQSMTAAEYATAAHQGSDAHAGLRAAAQIQMHHMRSPPPFRTIGSYMGKT